MQTRHHTRLAVLRKWVGLLALALVWPAGAGPRTAPEPAQSPQVNRQANARPNVVFIMDTSASMADPVLVLPHAFSAAATTSAQNNALAYDPRRTYELPLIADGIEAPQPPFPSNPNVLDPTDRSTWIFWPRPNFDVTKASDAELPFSSGNYNGIQIALLPASTTSTGHSKVFLFQQGGIGPTVTLTVNPFSGMSGRTDCLADPCTWDEEARNYARWAVYHSNRLRAATTAISRAFGGQGNDFRLAWTRLQSDALAGSKLIPSVRGFDAARGDFLKWLQTLKAVTATPLRNALGAAGLYFEDKTNAGPWAHTPWSPGSEQASEHLSCRRSFAILMTDGEWNDSTVPAFLAGQDTDGQPKAPIVHKNGITQYVYRPGDKTDPRSIGKSDNPSGAPGNAETLADVAMHFWSRDLRPDLDNNVSPGAPVDPPFWQNMVTFTIGYGTAGTLRATGELDRARRGEIAWPKPEANRPSAIDDLVHAAHNGGGVFLSATSPTVLRDGISQFLEGIAGERRSEAGVAVTGADLGGSATLSKIVPSYIPGRWWGNVEMFALDAKASVSGAPKWQVVGTDPVSGVPTGTTTIPPHNLRNIWTSSSASGVAVQFQPVPLTSAGLRSSATDPADERLSSHATNQVIAYLRGDSSREIRNGGILRNRRALLGDIVNSTPLHVRDGKPVDYSALPAGDPKNAWKDWTAVKAARTNGVVLVGANDGMLHAFRASDGVETFAYVPRAVLPRMHELSRPGYVHRYYVDGPLTEVDAWLPSPLGVGAPRWTNLVLGTAGAGARSVFALRLARNQPSALSGSSLMWEITSEAADFADLGHVTHVVEHGVTVGGQWVAILGNGHYSEAGKAVLYVVDLATGARLSRIEAPSAAPVTIGSRQTYNGLGGVRAVRNANMQIIGAYAGDLQGQLWKFDLSATDPASWRLGNNGVPLFVAKDGARRPQPIAAPPAAYPRNDPGYPGGHMVVVGTGRLIDESDAGDVQQQAVYGLWDRVRFGEPAKVDPILPSDLGTRAFSSGDKFTSTTAFVTAPTGASASQRGWVLPLTQKSGQRVVYPIVRVNDHVLIQTLTPALGTGESCSAQSALASNILMPAVSGTCRMNGYTFDFNGDGKFDDNDGAACVYDTAADGGDALLAVANAAGGAINRGPFALDIPSALGGAVGAGSNAGPKFCLDCAKTPPMRAWRQLFLRGNN